MRINILVIASLILSQSAWSEDFFVPDMGSKKETKLEFEEGVIEGMSQAPDNNVTVTSARKRKANRSLYSKRISLDDESRATIQGVRFSQ